MQNKRAYWQTFLFIIIFLFSSSSAIAAKLAESQRPFVPELPLQIDAPGEKVIIVDPSINEWGAYSENGELLRAGVATAGANYCRDIKRRCRTKVGTFRIYSLGSSGCFSRKFPVPRGGAPMPYCMFFNGGQALHGSARSKVVRANVSHGCVRLHVEDAKWLRFNFVEGPNGDNHYRGTKVIVRPY